MKMNHQMKNLKLKPQSKYYHLKNVLKVLKEGKVKTLSNDEVSSLVVGGKLPLYALENN